jgi:hypothetical protein
MHRFLKNKWLELKRMIDNMIVIAFQIIFCAEIHVNDFFYFLKIIFDINT